MLVLTPLLTLPPPTPPPPGIDKVDNEEGGNPEAVGGELFPTTIIID